MGELFNQSFYEGLLFCISLQLILISVFYFTKKKHFEIGIICLILGTNNLYTIEFGSLYLSLWGNLFFADYRSMIIPSLFYMYLQKKIDNNYKNPNSYKHLIVPGLTIVVYMILKFYFKTFYEVHLTSILTCFWSFGLLITLFYSYLGYRIIIRSKNVLVGNAYKRFLLICSLISLYIFSSLVLLISDLHSKIGLINLMKYYKLANFNFYQYLLTFLGNFAILIVGIIQLDSIKKYIISSNIHNQFDSIKNEILLKKFLKESIIEPKKFIDKDFNIKKAMHENGINHKDFKLFIKKEYQMTVNDYINHLRLDEFIKNSKTASMEKYDLEGLASMAGFSSKSTFYRVFKKEMKITPSLFIKNLANHD